MNITPNEKIIIADDSAFNREILTAILGAQYDIIEAEDGEEVLELLGADGEGISLVLLDIVMPKLDGFDVLSEMSKRGLIDHVPVIMISADSTPVVIRRAFDLGVSDYISRPFDAEVVRKRISNTLRLYSRQRSLVEMVTEEIYDKHKSSSMLITILSNVVEMRNGESGLHVLHVHLLTNLILRRLVAKTDRYRLSEDDIDHISMVSALHDIGKMSVPIEVLNKPGRLTPEEFEIIKTHTTAGCDLLTAVPFDRNEPILCLAYEICRWHHERYDGRGYPDGLCGEQIPISAQVVALADVYDALTHERVYKPAYSHAEAMEMILGGQCGVFNPLLLECLREASDEIEAEMRITSYAGSDKAAIIERTMVRMDDDLRNRGGVTRNSFDA